MAVLVCAGDAMTVPNGVATYEVRLVRNHPGTTSYTRPARITKRRVVVAGRTYDRDTGREVRRTVGSKWSRLLSYRLDNEPEKTFTQGG